MVKYPRSRARGLLEKLWRKGPGEKVSFQTRVEHQMRQANKFREWRTTGGCSGGTLWSECSGGGSSMRVGANPGV